MLSLAISSSPVVTGVSTSLDAVHWLRIHPNL